MRYSEKIDQRLIFNSDELNYDDYLIEYKDALKNRDCITCKFALNTGYMSQLECNHPELKTKTIKPFNGPECERRTYYSRWTVKSRLDVDYYIHKHEDVNQKLSSDIYDIYEYNTGQMIRKTKTVNQSFVFFNRSYEQYYDDYRVIFYIVKNQKYYYCQSRRSCTSGFIPLTDFRRVVDYGLVVFEDYQKAIKIVEQLDYQKAEKGTLIYTTGDILENKFMQLETEVKNEKN